MPVASRTSPRRARARGPLGTRLAELVWFRSLTAPHRTFVESAVDGRAVTYPGLRRALDRWSALLDDLRVPPGATVALAVSDPVDFTFVFLGVMAAGRVAGPLDPGATDAELSAACGCTGPYLVVGDRPAPTGLDVEWLRLPGGAFELFDPEPELAGPFPVAPTGPLPDAGTTRSGGVVLSTSGTTGVPKRIVLDEHQLLRTAAAVAAHHELSVLDRGFNPLPLFHINAEVVGLLATLVAGATLVLDDRFHRTGFWDTVARHRVTWVNAVPAILARLSVLEPGEHVPTGVRFARSASAPLPLPVLDRFERVTGIPVVETYGMTEAASQITANPVHGPRKPGSVGRPVGTEVRVVTDPGSGSVVGRVGIRGASVITSYAGVGYEDRFDTGGWLDTGDLGYLDEDGYLFLVGRADDVINRGGEKIFPKEVEDVVLGEPAVLAAAVVGWDHEVLGRVPVAYLVAHGVADEGDRAAAEEVVRLVQDRCTRLLSRPKRPVAFHVVHRLPAGATGKIRRGAVGGGVAIYSLLVQ